MKKRICIVMFYTAVIFLSGCIQPSLKPLFNEDEMFVDPNLFGVWKAVDSNETWEFKNAEEAGIYELVITDKKGKQGAFAAALGELEGELFLNIFPGQFNEEKNDYYNELVVGMHTCIWVKQIEPCLQMAIMDTGRVEEIIEKDANAVAHIEIGDDRIALAADTNDLQDFVIEYGIEADDVNSIFENLSEFTKVQN
ncbi:MAG: hypothetical protein ABFD79_12090 [Phycisphaerales bacterium]